MKKIQVPEGVKCLDKETFDRQRKAILKTLAHEFNLIVLSQNQVLCFRKDNGDLVMWMDYYLNWSVNQGLTYKYKNRLNFNKPLGFTKVEKTSFLKKRATSGLGLLGN